MILLICVVVPLAIGYIWPVDEGERTIYNVTDTKNVTEDFTNGTVGLYADYMDLYNNNFYQIYENNNRFFVPVFDPVSTSTSNSGLPVMSYYTQYKAVPIDQEDGAFVFTLEEWANTINPPAEAGTVSAVIISSFGWGENAIMMGYDQQFDYIIYYYDSGIALYSDPDDKGLHPMTEDNEIYLYYYGTGQTHPVLTTWLSYTGRYAVLSEGFKISNEVNNIWSNTYDNKIIDILFKTASVSEQFHMIFDVPNGNGGTQQRNLWVQFENNGNIWLTTDINGQHSTTYEYKKLGSAADIPFVLLRIDVINKTISLSALQGMNNYTDNYVSYIRSSVLIECDLTPITSFTYNATAASMSWYIPRTYSNITQTKGIDNARVNLRSYDANDFQIDFRTTQLTPNDDYMRADRGSMELLGITSGGTQDIYFIRIGSDGYVTVLNGVSPPRAVSGGQGGGSENQDPDPDSDLQYIHVPLKGLKIQFIDNAVYFNGMKGIEFSSYQAQIRLTLIGEWLTQIFFSDLEKSTTPTYEWEPGGFGLGVVGYASIGLLTSFAAAMIAMLNGRRTGGGSALYIFVSGICGFIYLLIMMNGL